MASKNSAAVENVAKLFQEAHLVKRKAEDFPPVASTAESKLTPILVGNGKQGVWFVRTNTIIPSFLKLVCTMTVYRDENGDITIFNAVRVSEEIEDEILALGKVANIVKLGQFHGASDAYWVLAKKFNKPKLWTLLGGTVAEGISADAILTNSSLPIQGAALYSFHGHPFPEAVMTLPCGAEGPLLVACDSLMHYIDPPVGPAPEYFNLEATDFLAKEGAPAPSPLWTRVTKQFVSGDRFRKWYGDICGMEWKALIGAHGDPVFNCCHDALKEAANERLSASVLS